MTIVVSERDAETVKLQQELGEGQCGLCNSPATLFVMHACGAPGGPSCDECWQRHTEYVTAMYGLADATPYCRHCGKNVDNGHVYAVPLNN